MITQNQRSVLLLLHIITSVGWLGAVAAFEALAITGITGPDVQIMRATYLTMNLIAWYVIVPLNMASLITGLVVSLTTKWGLFRHYWILIKFIITVMCTFVLYMHMQPISFMAQVAAQKTLLASDYRGVRDQMAADAGAALLALLVTTTLSVFKPRGLTSYGWRKLYGTTGSLPL